MKINKFTFLALSFFTFDYLQANTIEEVVVTSLGITREKQALGYAISEFDDTAL